MPPATAVGQRERNRTQTSDRWLPVADRREALGAWVRGIDDLRVSLFAQVLQVRPEDVNLAADTVPSSEALALVLTAVRCPEWAAGWAMAYPVHPATEGLMVGTVLRCLAIPLTEQPYAAAQVVEAQGGQS
jgi:hypothetical protein